MPIYEFVCQACGCEFEKIQSFSDKTMPTCPNCQSEQVVRQMSRPAIHFKGSGWYITDSKAENKDRKETPAKAANGETGEAKSSETANKEATTSSDSSSTNTDTKKADAKKTDTKAEAKASGTTEKNPSV